MLKEGIVLLILRQSDLHIWVLITEIMDEFIPEVDIMQTNDVSTLHQGHRLKLNGKYLFCS